MIHTVIYFDRWMWFFQDNKGRWVPYGHKAEALYDTGTMTKSSVTTDEIEEHFLGEILRMTGHPDSVAAPETAALHVVPVKGMKPLHFNTDFHKYEIDFEKMVQKNLIVSFLRISG